MFFITLTVLTATKLRKFHTEMARSIWVAMFLNSISAHLSRWGKGCATVDKVINCFLLHVTLALIGIKHCIVSTFPSSVNKEKVQRQITQVGQGSSLNGAISHQSCLQCFFYRNFSGYSG